MTTCGSTLPIGKVVVSRGQDRPHRTEIVPKITIWTCLVLEPAAVVVKMTIPWRPCLKTTRKTKTYSSTGRLRAVVLILRPSNYGIVLGTHRLHTIQDDGVGAPSIEGNPDYAEVDSSGALLISNGKVQVSGTQQGPYATTTLVEPPPFSQVRKH